MLMMADKVSLIAGRPNARYLTGFSSFHGSLTIGIVAISIEPRGLSGLFQFLKNAIASSAPNLPFVALIRSKIAAMPSQASTDRKLGMALSVYSRFQAVRKAVFAGRSPTTE